MTTAVQLVNRVRRRFREESSTSLTNDLSALILDLVNEAKRDLLEVYNWDFDKRTDGEMLTVAALTGQIVAVNNGIPSVTTSIPLASVIDQNAVARIVITSDSAYGDTALRVVSASAGGGFTTLATASNWPGTSNATATATLVFDEYVLPSTVRAVTSVRHQENDLQMIEVDRDLGIDATEPRPHGNTSNQPELVFIGKRVRSTFDTADASTDVSGISIKLDPTPASALLLTYSYVYRHPDLSSAQDLVGVDPTVEDLITRLAEARGTMSGLGADLETGAAMEAEVLNRAGALHGNSRRDPMRRVVITPTYGGRSIPYGFGRLPRNFGSLP